MGVISTIELTGVSVESWHHAAEQALYEASRTIRNITRMHVLATRAVVDDGVIVEYHTDVRIYFDVERSRST